MKHAILTALASLALLISGCAVDAPEPNAPDLEADLDDAAVLADGDSSDDTSAAPRGLKAPPAELSLVTNVPPGCAAEVRCAGPKTCAAWTPYAQCAPSYTTCAPQCGIPGRGTGGGTCFLQTHVPRNRTRTCTIRATGATCVEVDYLPNPSSGCDG